MPGKPAFSARSAPIAFNAPRPFNWLDLDDLGAGVKVRNLAFVVDDGPADVFIFHLSPLTTRISRQTPSSILNRCYRDTEGVRTSVVGMEERWEGVQCIA